MDADVMRKLAAMSPQERTRVVSRLRESAGTTAATPAATGPTRRDEPAGSTSASFVQEQMWFLHQLAPETPCYNVSFSFALTGPLDVPALRAALRDVVRGHDVLRARLVLDAGTLTQRTDVTPPELGEEDVPGADTAEREAALARRVRELSRIPFELGTGPLIRLALLRMGPEDHRLVWIAHHGILDGWSFGLLVAELGAAYRAALDGGSAPVDASRLRCADVAAWQHERYAAGEFAPVLDRWRERLAGIASVGVPTDRPRPAAQTFDGALVRFAVPDDVARGLDALADRAGAGLFSVLLAGYQALIARQSGASRVVVGVPLSGRGRPELDDVVGPLANTLPIPAEPAADVSFATLLGRVNDVVLDAIGDQEVPFGRLVEQLAQGRDPSRNPLFQTLFNLGNLPKSVAGAELAPGLVLHPTGHPNGTVRVDLELTMEQTGEGLVGRLEYNTALYEPATAERLVAAYQRVLAEVAADAGIAIRDLPGPVTTPAAAPAESPDRGARLRSGPDWADELF